MTLILMFGAVLAVLHGATAIYLWYGFKKQFSLCGFTPSPICLDVSIRQLM